MRKLLALVLALALLLPCAACGRAEEPEGLRLYFVTQTREHGQQGRTGRAWSPPSRRAPS